MPKYLLVAWHPEPQSMCMSVHRASVEALTAAGHEVQTSDLYAMKFNPVSGPENFSEKHVRAKEAFFKQQAEEIKAAVDGTFAPDVAAEQAKLAWADVVVFQFPIWWFSMPAVMKGWVDRVLAMGVSYGTVRGLPGTEGGQGGKFYDNGVYKGKRAIVSITTGGPEVCYTADLTSFNGDINGVLRPIHRGILHFCGFSVLAPHVVWAAAHGTDEERKVKLAEWATRVVTLDKEDPASYDEGRF